jgi:anthraniloyl-CoA monooxygenase
MRSGGNGFCGCSRVALLNILQDRGRELGVQMRFQREVEGLEEFADSDLIVVADGIGSKIRTRYADHFQPSIDLRPEQVHPGSARPSRSTPSSTSSARTPEGTIVRALLPVRARAARPG